VVIGAMKCATTSLHRYLEKHPDLAMSTPKELNFFLPDTYRELGTDWYRQQFVHPPTALVAGESSPNYSKRHEHPGVAERMARLVPAAKLIYVLRDPVKRIESHYVHVLGSGKVRCSFDDAIADVERSEVVQTSRYWWQLEAFLEHYPQEQIRIVSYERLSADPEAVVDEVLGFLSLDPGFRHPLIGERIHVAGNKRKPNRLGLLVWDDRTTRRRLLRYARWAVSSPIERPQWNPRTLARVKDYLAEDVAAMRRFSGQAFSEWSI
jgi:hypothetical protein